MSSVLPPLYAAWIEELLHAPLLPETAATCEQCAMLPPAGSAGRAAERDGDYFNPAIKCCTYLPEIPNYLVGRILSDEDPDSRAGRDTVRARIARGVSVTPLGLFATPTHGLLYEHGAALAFGRSLSLRCPHYLEESGGLCGVWRHRASVCATWFCKYVRGATGMEFWRTLHQLLSIIEAGLSRHFVLHGGLPDEVLRALFPPPQPGGQPRTLDAHALDGTIDPARKKELWGSWLGREESFYRSCAERVATLSPGEILSICGAEAQIAARLLRSSHDRLTSNQLPEALEPGPVRLVQIRRDAHRVVSYNAYDPIELPGALSRVLGYFDGRPTEQALRAISDEQGITLDATLLRKLLDFRILVPSGD